MSLQLAERRVVPAFSEDRSTVAQLVILGRELVELWDVETVTPIDISGGPGNWHFVNHDQADDISIHGRRALATWRQARVGDWSPIRATEYARSVASILRVRAIADEVTETLGT